MTRTQAKRFREMITRAAAKLTNAEALTSISLFEPWSGEKDYSIGDRVRDGGKLYRCYNAISANPTWRPSVTPAHWEPITVGEDGATHQCLEDIALMRVTEVFAAIPFLPFAMILSSIMSHMPWSENAKIFLLMCILGVLSWTGLARLVRGQVLVARENEYVTAAKAMGVKESKIAFKHILPNVISIIIVTLTLDFATCMLTESSLSYLGFGVTPPRPTWGNMLNGANNMTVMNNYWWQWLFTALFLAVTTICINIIGDALRDVMDPKSNAER